MRVPLTHHIVAPLWIIGFGVVAAAAPPPDAAIGAFLLIACVVVVPVIITRLLWTPYARPSTKVVLPHSIRLAR